MSVRSCVVSLGLVTACSALAGIAEGPPPGLRGPYFGQSPPGREAQVFAPGLVSVQGRYEYALGYSPDGRQFLFTAQVADGPSYLLHARVVDGRWTVPQRVSLSAGARKAEMEAFFAPDGRRLYFAPYDEGMDVRIWTVELGPDGWANPREVGPPVSEDPAFFPTVARSGALYYTNLAKRKIYRALIDGERVAEASDAGISFGGHSFIAPDESFVLLDAQADDTRGERDIYVAFKQASGAWTAPVNLGDAVNTQHSETCPSLSADGKYLYFSRYDEEGQISNIYWIESSVIDEARGTRP